MRCPVWALSDPTIFVRWLEQHSDLLQPAERGNIGDYLSRSGVKLRPSGRRGSRECGKLAQEPSLGDIAKEYRREHVAKTTFVYTNQ